MQDGMAPIDSLIMINAEKFPGALYALNGVLVQARTMAYEGASNDDLADILDAAEALPRLIASEVDETDKFHRNIKDIATRHRCDFILKRFDEASPRTW